MSGDFCVSGFLLSLWTERGPILVSFARLEPSQWEKSGKVTVRVGCAMHLVENLRRRSFSHADAVGADK